MRIIRITISSYYEHTIIEEKVMSLPNNSIQQFQSYVQIKEVATPESFWLWAIYYWAKCKNHKHDPQPMLSAAFSQIEIDVDGDNLRGAKFHYCLTLLHDDCIRPLTIGCEAACGVLGLTERIILACIALQQRDSDSRRVSGMILSNFLPELGADYILGVFDDLASISKMKGMHLPVRPNYLDLAKTDCQPLAETSKQDWIYN